MQSKITLKKMGGYFQRALIIFILGVCAFGTKAQTTLTTETGTGYTGQLGLIGGNDAVTFVIENTNAVSRTLTQIDMTWDPFYTTGSADVTLWYTTTSLGGAPTIANPTWSVLATSTVNVTGPGYLPTFTGLSFTLAAGTQYRFAVESSNGIGYSPAAATPNIFTGDGVNLKTNDFLIGGGNVGYSGAFPTLANNPRAFTGRVTFINTPAACSGTPAPGNTNSTHASVCPTVPFTLSIQNPPGGSGVNYQWQTSPDGVVPYTDIPGANAPTYTTTLTASTYYRANLTCTGSGLSATSTPLQVLLTPSSGCYCTAGATDVNPIFEKIANVTYADINNSSVSALGYEDFTSISTDVISQSNLPLTVNISNGYPTDQVIVWIDFNHNGLFTDPGERVMFSALGVGPQTANIAIPASAALGSTRMRVRLHDTGFGGNATPCGTSTYGQVEDYTVNILPCEQGVINADPTDATTSCGNTANFFVDASGSLLSYQWEQRISPNDPWTSVPGTSATLTLTNVPESNNGYQYRALVSGPCTATIFSAPATLTVTPYVPAISPTPAIVCTGGSLQIFASPQPTVTTVSSGPLNIVIPDGNPTGIHHTITMAGIPAGATITDISVKLNVAHNYVADLELVVEAPDGKILNLSDLIGGANNPGVNFTNTVFSSNATAALNTGISPGYTGNFKPDAAGAVAAFGIPGGPTGYLPTFATGVGTLAALGDQPNGDWTIAMYDAGPPDQGTLLNWSVSITWGVTPATAVFSDTNHLFLDAALTLPYHPGMSVSSVYTNTPVDTTYTAVVSTSTCTATVQIPVVVAHALTDIVSPTDQKGCIDHEVSFTTSATGGPFNTRWEESADGGATWSPISNGGDYSGATTTTLTISNLTTAYDGYQYRAILDIPSCGTSDTTTAAALSIHPNPIVVVNAGPYTRLFPGLTTTLTAAVSPNAAATYQWYLNGILIPGATNATYTADIDGLGDYYATVNDVNGCNGTSNTITIADSANDMMFIYPNPSSGQFQVRYYSVAGNSLVRGITIYDSKGSRVYHQTYGINVPYGRIDVDLSGMGKGVYMVELENFTGARLKTGRVVIR